MIAGLINAAEAVILLAVITRVLPMGDAGIMTFAFAIANLMLTFGKAGMRGYQVTDTSSQFNFKEYFCSRIITTALMIIVSGFYSIYCFLLRNYTLEKATIVFFVCLLYSVDALEDVFHGLYQKKGRLDVSSKCFSIRWGTILSVFILVLFFSKDLVITNLFCVILSYILLLVLLFLSYPYFRENDDSLRWKKVFILLWNCLPLFLVSFFTFYIGNAPKYAIDKFLTDEEQALYGFIAMPVFVVGLVNNFLYQPKLVNMSFMWRNKELKKFSLMIKNQILVIVLITIICIIGAYFLGIPVLSILYNTQLVSLKKELIILILGGGGLALAGFYGVILTIMRHQKSMLWCYFMVVFLSILLSDSFIIYFGLLGASMIYFLLMMCLSILLWIAMQMGIKGQSNSAISR